MIGGQLSYQAVQSQLPVGSWQLVSEQIPPHRNYTDNSTIVLAFLSCAWMGAKLTKGLARILLCDILLQLQWSKFILSLLNTILDHFIQVLLRKAKQLVVKLTLGFQLLSLG